MSRRRLVDELTAREPEILDRIVARARAEVPAYAGLAPAALRPLTMRMVESTLISVVEQRKPSAAELSAFREFGVVRARQGIALSEMLIAWRIGVRELLDEITEIGRNHNFADRLQLELTREMLDIVDTATVEFSSGHREVELEYARRDHQARADFVRSILTGTIGLAEIGVRAQQYGLDLNRRYLPFRARPSATCPAEDIERLLVEPGRTGFVTSLDGDLAGLVEHLPDAVPAPLGYAAAAPVDHLSGGFVQATRALHTAAAFDLVGAHDLAALGLLPAVLADPEIGDLLVHRYMDPLHRTGIFDLFLQTLRCYLDTGLHVETTAQRLVVHPNTVRYRIDRYQTLAGIDLREPQTRFELWWALNRHHLQTTRDGSA